MNTSGERAAWLQMWWLVRNRLPGCNDDASNPSDFVPMNVHVAKDAFLAERDAAWT
jgi:hypothetical protein